MKPKKPPSTANKYPVIIHGFWFSSGFERSFILSVFNADNNSLSTDLPR